MLNKKDYIYITIFLLLVSSSVYNMVFKANKTGVPKTAYVDVKSVFEGFQMKEELQKKLEKELITHRSYLDSLMFNVQSLKNKLETQKNPSSEEVDQYNQLQMTYYEHKKEIDKIMSEITMKYDAQIIEQMTQYIQDYGALNNYDLIFGENESGNVLYGKVDKEITKEVIVFINDKYQGN